MKIIFYKVPFSSYVMGYSLTILKVFISEEEVNGHWVTFENRRNIY